MTKNTPPPKNRNTPAPDIDKVAAELELIIGESARGVMTSHGITLLLMWNEAWEAFNAPHVDGLEAIQLNTELIQIGRIMEACSIISPSAAIQLNYVIYSLIEYHLRSQKRNREGDYIIQLHLQDSTITCQRASISSHVTPRC